LYNILTKNAKNNTRKIINKMKTITKRIKESFTIESEKT
jgi:hypothetical protein